MRGICGALALGFGAPVDLSLLADDRHVAASDVLAALR